MGHIINPYVLGASAPAWADNNSYDFDGSTGYITFGNDMDCDRLEAMSIAFWFKVDTIPGSGQDRLFHKRSGADEGWWIAIHDSGKLRFNFENDSGSITWIQTNTTISTGTWYHAICKAESTGKTPSDMTILLDGSTDVGTTFSGITSGSTSTSSSLIFGATDSPGSYFDGHLNEVCGWPGTSINGTTETDAYNSGTSSDPSTWDTPPDHYWKADGDTTGAGNVIDHGTDGTASGTITGGVTISTDV